MVVTIVLSTIVALRRPVSSYPS